MHPDIAAREFALATLPPDTPPERRATAIVDLARLLVTRDSARTRELIQEALALIPVEPPSALWFAAQMLHTLALYQLGDLAGTIANGQDALPFVDDDRPTEDMFRLLSRLTWTYADLGQIESALGLNRRAMAMAHRAENLAWEALAFSDLGVVYDRWGKPNESCDAFLACVEPARFAALSGDDKALICYNVSGTYLDRGDADHALQLSEIGLAALRTSYLLTGRGNALAALGDLTGAEEALREAVDLAREVRDFYDEQAALNGLALVLHRQGRSEEAIRVVREATTASADAPALKIGSLELLTQIYADTERYREAYLAMRELGELQEVARSERAAQQTQALEQQFRSELDRRATEQLRKEQEILRERNAALQLLVAERDAALAAQQRLVEAITELSTPILPLATGVLALPIIGVIDERRISVMIETALHQVQNRNARVLLLDVTGVPIMETSVAAGLLQIAHAVRLLGCRVVLVGVRPEIAQTLVSLGVDLSELTTRATLAEGLITAMTFGGRRIVAA